MSGRTLTALSAEETTGLGARLGATLKRRGRPVTVCLYGDLGAGKTTFIKGFASAFGIPERDIGSASYVIVAEYDTSPAFYHMDLYRLDKESCDEDAGIWEYIESDGIVVVEWAERLGEPPEGSVTVTINITDTDGREIAVAGLGPDEAQYLMESPGER
jgi:tRNA threonylcarbamoyladenosine biosynthesis protein TsaE